MKTLKLPRRLRFAPPGEGITDGALITRARIAAQLTQEGAARAVGVTVTTICSWERSRTLKPYQLEGTLVILQSMAVPPAEEITEGAS